MMRQQVNAVLMCTGDEPSCSGMLLSRTNVSGLGCDTVPAVCKGFLI